VLSVVPPSRMSLHAGQIVVFVASMRSVRRVCLRSLTIGSWFWLLLSAVPKRGAGSNSSSPW